MPNLPRLLALSLPLALAAGCYRAPAVGDGVVRVASESPEHYRLRYLDGQLSLNESCGIKRGNRLNARIPPMRVNGRPIGFC